jgi:deoxyinosine 3'endonuclease (endonuclease V)
MGGVLHIPFASAKTNGSSEQTRLTMLVIQKNILSFSAEPPFDGLKYIAGVDISFVKNTNKACAMLSILRYPDFLLINQTYEIVEMTEAYIPFYLAFREVRHLLCLFKRVESEDPEVYPQVVFVDGGGVWHPKGKYARHTGINSLGLGLASHLGVLLNIPTIGVAKSILYLPDIPFTLTYEKIRSNLLPSDSFYPVKGTSGTVYGAGVIPRKARNVEKPIFVSVGHLLDLPTAVELVHWTSKYRIPEAIRAADGGSREILRQLEEGK